MLSMTGFGSERIELAEGSLQIQVSAVNHRHCQVSIRSDVRDLALEERIRKLSREQLKRGSIHVNVQWQANSVSSLPIDQLRHCWQQFSALASELGAPEPRLEDLSAWMQGGEQEGDSETLHSAIHACLEKALSALQDMRKQEGENLRTAFQGMQQDFQALREKMGEQESGRIAAWRDHLFERLQQVLGERETVTDEMLIRELAIYTDRIDVSEELVRLDSHLQQLATLFSAEASGKKIEFLLQECGREVNTIGSKANDAGLSQLVVEAKSILEQMREQAANIL
ncbi:MAG: DUF1732 domain-containing protein [Planctomycetes bacterium]|nr:DUF1732 domain-containing protein [Planctomycetota bacterium]